MVMTETTIELPEEILTLLREIADERRVPVSEVILESLAETIESRRGRVRPKPQSIGMFPSEHTDLSVRAGNEPIIPEPWS